MESCLGLLLFVCLLGAALAGSVVKRHHTRHDKDKNRSINIQKTLELLIKEFYEPEPQLTCWTCPSMNENGECNDWAPDIPCSDDHTVCKTIHHIHKSSGQSKVVAKMCATPDQCTADMVGCRNSHIPGVMTCVSCCTDSYCNEAVPVDHASALRLSSLPGSSAASLPSTPATLGYVILLTTVSWILKL